MAHNTAGFRLYGQAERVRKVPAWCEAGSGFAKELWQDFLRQVTL